MAATTLDDVDGMSTRTTNSPILTQFDSTSPRHHKQPLQPHRTDPRLPARQPTSELCNRNVTVFQASDRTLAKQLSRKQLIRNLVDLTQAARRLPDHIPIELIEYIESTRNPDIYTREFVELVMRYNQQQKGRIEAFASFRDILAEQMMVGIPDIREDVKTVLIASGGRAD